MMQKDIKLESVAKCSENIHFLMALASKAKGEGRGGDFLRDALTKNAQLIEEVSRADAGSI